MLTQQDASFTVIALLLAPLLCTGQDLGGRKGKSKTSTLMAQRAL